jgi:hypothetical protein
MSEAPLLEGGLGRICLDSGSGAEGVEALLACAELKAIVAEAAGAGAMASPAAARLAAAPVPVAAVSDDPAVAFDFRFPAHPPGEAERFLRGLTANRSPRLIRAILGSIRNASRIPVPDALRREAELFCDLAGEPS